MGDINKQADAPQTPNAIHLKDYQAPAYWVEQVDMEFELAAQTTRVKSLLHIRRNEAVANTSTPLVLDGHDMTLLSVAIDDKQLADADYQLETESLTIKKVPSQFVLETVGEIQPAANTALEGLYASSRMLCTQCEAQGFRRITYFPDRPDVMSRYRVKLIADKKTYPVLLCNGNPIEQGDLDNGRHYVIWEDPSLKPSYLFALVAGDLKFIEDEFTTMSGRKVQLRLYTEAENIHKCDHAMASLKQAMAWDEKTYGREYDLDIYMIVAVNDFNMGAMENKGLNIFNASCVLASPETATDDDFYSIQSIIGHEYFHNWSGNRVTCRDWFQLSLKEGFTVFRDQEFSADMTSRAVKRIYDVNLLRTHQFREDAGPMAHPVRPDSYVEINNFYTMTVYNKGAEVVRMLHTLLGAAAFRRGTDLYFQRHDGQAVTTDDFVRALEDANGADFSQFRRWYSQAGTPELKFDGEYDAAKRSYRLRLSQRCPATPGQETKDPFHIPLALALLDAQGREMPLRLRSETQASPGTRVLALSAAEQEYVFEDVATRPVPSLLRDFSAPVKLSGNLTRADEIFLMGHDANAFNRWDVGQRLLIDLLLAQSRQAAPRSLNADDKEIIAALRRTLLTPGLDDAFIAQTLSLPAESYIAEFMPVIDPLAIHETCRFLRTSISRELFPELLATYERCHDDGPYRPDADAIGRRSLQNVCLAYLADSGRQQAAALVARQFAGANNMTDRMAALGCMVNVENIDAGPALGEFYEQWQHDQQVVEKWLAVQSSSRLPDALRNTRALLDHPAFSYTNPNKVRALIGGFASSNINFHAADGAGYEFVADQVLLLNDRNPIIAARLAGAFTPWRRYDSQRQQQMCQQLERIAAHQHLSRDVYEIVSRSLG